MGLSAFKKIIKEHLVEGEMRAGEEIGIRIDQVLVQDITGTVAMLNFEAMGLERIACDVACVYADHKVLQFDARDTADHVYLASAAKKYGFYFAMPGAGIGHQIHLEHFAKPGKTALGADSHTPHCGGIGMVAIGAGGLDVAVAAGGGAYFFKMPEVVKVNVVGKLKPWVTAKDVILEMLRRVTVRGGLGKVFEYVGEGIKSLNAQQRVTITNMSTELGATTSIFPSDEITLEYFERIGRKNDWVEILPDVDANYDEEILLDLSQIDVLVAKPSLPDNVVPISDVEGTPIHQIMVGSCTNGSYTDLRMLAEIIKGRKVAEGVHFFIQASSRKDLEILAEEGLAGNLISAGITISEPTCGACIGISHVPAEGTNSLRVINRNFKGRSGNANDAVYLSSTAVAGATALTGVLSDPRKLPFDFPGEALPASVSQENSLLIPPVSEEDSHRVEVIRGDNIVPVMARTSIDKVVKGEVIIKVGDDITTDHIMPAGAEILVYRSNIPKLSEFVFHRLDPEFSKRAQEKGGGIIVGGLNYGQGSSREHAAIAPMYLGVKAVIAKTIARIHRSNLINWGILPLTFADATAYDQIQQGDMIELRTKGLLSGENVAAVSNLTRGLQFTVVMEITDRERRILSSGGRLGFAKASPR